MQQDHGLAHYAPASVGALADTAFLRSAAMYSNDERHAKAMPSVASQSRWISALRALAVALRRH